MDDFENRRRMLNKLFPAANEQDEHDDDADENKEKPDTVKTA